MFFFVYLIDEPEDRNSLINVKKIDEKDLVFVKKNFTKQEDLAFSEFLKNRKNSPDKKVQRKSS
jgi:hypothetical protein